MRGLRPGIERARRRSVRFVGQLFLRPVRQNDRHVRRDGLCAGQIVLLVIAALPLLRAGDFALVIADEGEGVAHQRDGVRFGDGVPGQEVEARAAAHRADVDDLVAVGAVAREGGKQVLEGVHRAVGHVDVFRVVRHDGADVVGDDVAVDAGNIHALFQFVVVDGEAGDGFHGHFSSVRRDCPIDNHSIHMYIVGYKLKIIIARCGAHVKLTRRKTTGRMVFLHADGDAEKVQYRDGFIVLTAAAESGTMIVDGGNDPRSLHSGGRLP